MTNGRLSAVLGRSARLPRGAPALRRGLALPQPVYRIDQGRVCTPWWGLSIYFTLFQSISRIGGWLLAVKVSGFRGRSRTGRQRGPAPLAAYMPLTSSLEVTGCRQSICVQLRCRPSRGKRLPPSEKLIFCMKRREKGESRGESGSDSDQGIMTHSEMSVEGRDVSLGDDSVEDVAVFFVSHRSFAQEKTEGWVR